MLASIGITSSKAMKIVDTIFWRKRNYAKYSKPMVNPDFICLYVFQYVLSKNINKIMFAIPMANAMIIKDRPSSPVIICINHKS